MVLLAVGTPRGGKHYFYFSLNLNWNEGNIWKARIKPVEYIEYKLVLLEHDYIKLWEGGGNRHFSLAKVNSELEKLGESKEDIYKFNVDGIDYQFIRSSGLLEITLDWNH